MKTIVNPNQFVCLVDSVNKYNKDLDLTKITMQTSFSTPKSLRFDISWDTYQHNILIAEKLIKELKSTLETVAMLNSMNVYLQYFNADFDGKGMTKEEGIKARSTIYKGIKLGDLETIYKGLDVVKEVK